MDKFFGRHVTYDKPNTGKEINKKLRKFNKNLNTTKICVRFMEIFVLLFFVILNTKALETHCTSFYVVLKYKLIYFVHHLIGF